MTRPLEHQPYSFVIKGDSFTDDRGTLSFVNDFDFQGIKRFYVVANHHRGIVRAWHAHRYENKYVYVITGAALVGYVKIDNWENPSKDENIPNSKVLSASKPEILHIPSGHANGFMSLTDDTRVMFLSSSSVEESKNDDIRYNARLWDIWNIKER